MKERGKKKNLDKQWFKLTREKTLLQKSMNTEHDLC